MKLNSLGFFATLFLLILSACTNSEPETEAPQGIASLAARTPDEVVITKDLDTITYKTVPVERTGTYTYYENVVEKSVSKYVKPSGPVDPPPVVEEPGIPAGMKRVLSVDFENGSTQVSKDAASQAGVGTVVNYNGSKQFRAYVAKGSKQIHGGYRSELRYENISDAGRTVYEFDITFVQVPNTGEVQFWQVHPPSSTGSSLFRLQCHGNQFSVVRNPSGKNFYEPQRQAIKLGQQYHVKIDANWSNGSDGYIKVFIDGAEFYSFKGATGVGYSKFFINCWSSSGGSPTQNVEVYGDNLAIYKPN